MSKGNMLLLCFFDIANYRHLTSQVYKTGFVQNVSAGVNDTTGGQKRHIECIVI